MILNQKLGWGKQILRFLKRNFIENQISVLRVVIFCISGFYSTVFFSFDVLGKQEKVTSSGSSFLGVDEQPAGTAGILQLSTLNT